jgi:hypothetical protein
VGGSTEEEKILTMTDSHDHSTHISALQAEAWEICNQGYSVPDGDSYRALGVELYQQDLRERIRALFARLDQQNAEMDAALGGDEGPRAA